LKNIVDTMKVKILEPSQYSKWDTFVDQSPQGAVFCYSWWLEAITKSNFKILAVYEDDEIVAGFPLAYDLNGKINIPPLTRTLGVLFKDQQYNSLRKKTSVERRWLTELLKLVSPDDFVQICTHHNFTDWLPFRWIGLSQTTRYTYIINYSDKTVDDLLLNLEPENRRIIKKAAGNGIRIEITDDFELVYHYESLSYERQGLKFRVPYNDLVLLDKEVRKRGNRVIFKAVDNENKVHAALYAAFNMKSAFALLSGSDPRLRKQGGHTLVMWEALKYFSDKVEYFNLGGSDIERIESHLRGFGGSLTPYFHIFNERQMRKRNDLRYHLKETSFHLTETLKTVKNKITGSFRKK
jgi:hypothetical protein